MRGYSIRPDGSRLTPLLPRSRSEVAVTVSGDGRIVAYPGRGGAIYVSSASGAGLRRVVPDAAVGAALSRDGKLLAFGTGSTISIVGTDGRGRRRVTSGDDWFPDWSPDGRALAFVHDLGDDREALAVQPLQGARRLLAQAEWVDTPKWSPDGRWIAYLAEDSLYVVRPDGSDPRLLAPAFEVDDLSWSPDGRRVALANNGDVLVVDLDGRQRRLHLPRLYVGAVAWAPDGARLALTGGTTSQIWIVRTDGRGLRRVTSSGRNGFVGWTRLAPILPPARPIPRAERIVGRRTLVLRTAVTSIAAAGGRVAFITGPTATDCDHVAVWTPAKKTVWRSRPAPCGPREYTDPVSDVALTRERVAWRSEDCCGNYKGTFLITQSLLAGPDAPADYVADATVGREGGAGSLVGSAVGHESTLAFTVLSSTSRGALSTTVWRLGGGGSCPTIYSAARPKCTEILKADGEVSLLAVDARRIVVGTASGLHVLTTTGDPVRTLLVDAGAIALSGDRLAVETLEAIEVYDLRSGRRTRRFPTLSGLQDLEGDLLVAATSGGVPVVRSLRTGRQITFPEAGTALLERPGLFLTGSGRITFTPMRELRRRLR
jgi:dipeptidyl aminopeptidase/acylaminoacyl peptidase